MPVRLSTSVLIRWDSRERKEVKTNEEVKWSFFPIELQELGWKLVDGEETFLLRGKACAFVRVHGFSL